MSTELLARFLLYFTQIGFACAMAGLLWHFYTIYQRHYLKSWAIAFSCFALFVGFILTGVQLAAEQAPLWLRQLNSFFNIGFCYAFAVWLLVGVHETVTAQRTSSRRVNQLLAGLALLAFISVWPVQWWSVTRDWASFLQVNLRLLLIGLSVTVSGAWLWTLNKQQLAVRIVASAMLLWGSLFLLTPLLLQLLPSETIKVSFVIKYLELFVQMVLSLGLVIWLQQDERQANQQLAAKTQYLDSHDPLTGALNRDALLLQLGPLLAGQKPCLLLMIGLDSFKVVNESVGLKQGDRILREVTRRLESSIIKPVLVARTGGDIFALVVQDCTTDRQKLFLLQHLEQLIEKPFSSEQGLIKLTASVGVAEAPLHGDDAELLLRRANIAFHHCKRHQQNCSFYQPGMEEESARLLSLEKDLLQALEQDQFIFYFQPQWNLRDGRIEAYEALVRWIHPDKGLLMPGQFLPLVEQVGLSQELDLLLLEKAVATLADWKRQGITVPLAVNMSPVNFQLDGLKKRLQQLLLRYQVSPAMLELEITENTAMNDMEKGSNYVAELQQMGIRVSIDDFGTGYSSLGYLRKMPIDKIKIDRSFVTEMATNDSDMMIIKTMVTLAHGLGKRILAEGVENQAQLEVLRALSCDAIQGYLLAKPLPEQDALALLATDNLLS
ncbi:MULTISPECIES: putative bifunctional diguanylate cyclase/phosphodiesterase [Rheinheimera]|uniref:Bifunctional diguanylate cyclase/phosphodiesterase n=1 Tax=Rheinheimera marina TaxID=1774958 RepID=A0ABV9JMN4_9GAMM